MLFRSKQLAGCLIGLVDEAALADVLNTYAETYRDALCSALFARLGLKRRDPALDLDLVNTVFQALGAGDDTLRWEPFFFDWFGGGASEARAMAGPRRALYEKPEFTALRKAFEAFEPDRPERLSLDYFIAPEPQELLIDEIEQIWSRIDQDDDWTGLETKLANLERMRSALA